MADKKVAVYMITRRTFRKKSSLSVVINILLNAVTPAAISGGSMSKILSASCSPPYGMP